MDVQTLRNEQTRTFTSVTRHKGAPLIAGASYGVAIVANNSAGLGQLSAAHVRRTAMLPVHGRHN